MAKEKVTLTLSRANLRQLRSQVGGRSVSATVDTALAAHLAHLRHLAAVDAWLAEMEEAHGPIPSTALDWATRLVDQWDARRKKRRRRAA